MSLTEFTLILAYQRGGWISYPLTLLVVWFCIYVLDEDEQSAAEVIAKAKGATQEDPDKHPNHDNPFAISGVWPRQVGTDCSPTVDTYVERAAGIGKRQDRAGLLESNRDHVEESPHTRVRQ